MTDPEQTVIEVSVRKKTASDQAAEKDDPRRDSDSPSVTYNEGKRGSLTFRADIIHASSSSFRQASVVGRRIPFYSVPHQRQRWDEDQPLPHVNWGDLFFDEFYVAAAYNLGVMLMGVLTPDLWFPGLIYFVGMFGPLYMIWAGMLMYDARYIVVDYAHQIANVARTVLLAFSILHVEALSKMSDPRQPGMFLFCLGILMEAMLELGFGLEVYFRGEGDPAIKPQSRRTVLERILPKLLIYVVATALSGTNYFLGKMGEDVQGLETTVVEEQHIWSIHDLPIILCLFAYVYTQVVSVFRSRWGLPAGDQHKLVTVPVNVDFCIHRIGEWIMLMLGEIVLSLLIVEVLDTPRYYGVALVGIGTAVLFQLLHFESQPHHAEGHAIKRGKETGAMFMVLIQLYSMSLIGVGVAYKAMLSSIVQGGITVNRRLVLLERLTGLPEQTLPIVRSLASSDFVVTDQASAATFSVALTSALFVNEMMTVTHKGLHANIRRCFIYNGAGEKVGIDWSAILLNLFKAVLILFTATLSQWLTDPPMVTLAGFLVVGAVVVTRIYGWRIFHAVEMTLDELERSIMAEE